VLDQENKIIDMNNIAEKIFNIKSKMSIGQDVYTEFKEYQEIIKYIYEEKETSFNCEIKIKNKLYYFKGKLTLINNNRGKGKVIVLSDNTEQVLMIKKLEYYGITDVLTGVYNRKYFYKIAKEKIEACSDKKHMSLLMMDIDKFKNINDTYGHPTGDVVLKKVMNICKELLGKKYYIGRYGGEEFLILLDNANSEKALEIGETIRRRIENLEILHDNKCIKITSSFGIFTSVRERDLENMIKFADKALYEAKSLGRNRVSIKMGNS
jgi:diguanylate cyclase (GGDEF)-like protein